MFPTQSGVYAADSGTRKSGTDDSWYSSRTVAKILDEHGNIVVEKNRSVQPGDPTSAVDERLKLALRALMFRLRGRPEPAGGLKQ